MVVVVGVVVFVVGVLGCFFGIDFEEGVVYVVGEVYWIEDEEFWFWIEEGLFGDVGGF